MHKMSLRSATRDLANEVGENHEILKRVFANLDETELVKCSWVCRTWKREIEVNFKQVGKYIAKRAEIVGSFGEFAALNGLGHYRGIDTGEVRNVHRRAELLRVLRAMEAGFTKFNLKFYNFGYFDIRENGWRMQYRFFWLFGSSVNLRLTYNGNPVEFEADVDALAGEGICKRAKKLRPYRNGIVLFAVSPKSMFVRWNITLKK